MKEIRKLESLLQTRFNWDKRRINLMSLFMVSLIKVKTVNLTQIALSLNPAVSTSSNYRRLQRFFASFEFDFKVLAQFIVSLLPKEKRWILTLDRTNWKLGKSNINLLVLAIAYKGIAFPVLWSFLSKRGNSNTSERIELLNSFIDIFGTDNIHCLVADREFIGNEWIAYLKKEQIRFYLRIRANAKVRYQSGQRRIDRSFRHLKVNEHTVLSTRKQIYGHKLFVTALRLPNEYLIILTNALPERAIELYKERWQIETLFAALKSRGFDFEETHLTKPQRVNKLLALMALTFCWTHLIGEWQHQLKPIKIKKHNRYAKSIFRYGLDFLRKILLAFKINMRQFNQAIEVLSCT